MSVESNASLQRQLPFEAFEYVRVQFPDNPNTYMRIPHSLRPQRPGDVIYIPVTKSRECVINDNRLEGGDMPWTLNSIVLASNVGPVQVTLLLAIPWRNTND